MVHIAFAFLCLVQIGTPFQDPARTQLKPIAVDSAERAERVKTIGELIEKLDAKEYKVRSDAQAKLEKIACNELELIKEAATTGSPEVAMRVRLLIEKFSSFSNMLTDAVGNGIPGAKVTIEFAAEKLDLTSDGCGHLKIPESFRQELLHKRPKITVSQEDYGVALADALPGFERAQPSQRRAHRGTMVTNVMSIPLVNRNSEARERAVKGKVVQADGKPVTNARVTCRMVRTPGMGMMQPGDSQTVLANVDGEFSLYLDQRRCTNRALPSKLISPNSNYSLQVEDPDGELFPWGGDRSNLETKPIVLQKPGRKFEVRVLDEAGKEVVDENELSYFFISYRCDGNRGVLRGDFVKRGWLLPGKYDAIRRPIPGQGRSPHGGKYATVTIKDDSPDKVTFAVAQPREIRGTVVDAETGKSISNAIVATLCSTSDKRLTDLSDDDWTLIENAPARFEKKSLDIVRSIFGREATATKSNEKGEFVISESVPGVMHSVVVFTRTTVPMRESLYCVDEHLKDGKGNPRFTLYPSAFVTVRPKEGTTKSSYCWWVIHEGKTNELTKLLKTAARNSNGQYAHYARWLPLGKPAKLIVPANTRLQIELKPSGETYSDKILPQEINLDPGEHFELDPFDFEIRTPLTIRIVDETGKPVEGVSVRTSSNGRYYSVGVNSDVNGLAVCMVDRNSDSHCRVGGILYHSKIPNADKLKVKFTVGEKAEEPLVIKMTQKQIEAILSKPEMR